MSPLSRPSFLAKIHPGHLTPQESKQLFNLLTNTFRKHLVTEHDESSPGPSARSFILTKTEDVASKLPLHPESRPSPASAQGHIHSILTDPLFNQPLNRNAPRKAIDPMDGFEQAVARGLMTVEYAGHCLKAKQVKIMRGSANSIQEGMRESGAGFKVIKWLVNSGTANNNDFLDHQGLSLPLMDFIVAEKLQEIAWVWIKRAFQERTPLTSVAASKKVAMPLLLLIKAEAGKPGTLDDAIMCISQATQYSGLARRTQAENLLKPSARYLIHTAIMSSADQPLASTENFELFYKAISSIPGLPKWSLPYLSLRHPTNPSAEVALAFIRGMDLKSQPTWSTPPKNRRIYIRLCLDTAKFLFENNRHDQGAWLMSYLSSNFPQELGLEKSDGWQVEASSLGLLDSLRLA